MNKFTRVVPALMLVVSMVGEVNAQGKNGLVRTTVLDQNKASLRGASITLTNIETKAVQKCTSNEKGECKFEVPAGKYELITELRPRFCPLEVSEIKVKEDETVPVELKLTPVQWKGAGPEYEKLLKASEALQSPVTPNHP
jgi:hypothetical protein